MVEGPCLSLSTDNAPVTVQGVVKKSRAHLPSPCWVRGQLAAVALLLHATAAFSDTYRFGAAEIEWTGAEVIFRNDLTPSPGVPGGYPNDFHRDMTNGFTVRVVIMQGNGLAPDIMMVIPPAGYIAVPESVTVEEHEEGVIVIALEGLS